MNVQSSSMEHLCRRGQLLYVGKKMVALNHWPISSHWTLMFLPTNEALHDWIHTHLFFSLGTKEEIGECGHLEGRIIISPYVHLKLEHLPYTWAPCRLVGNSTAPQHGHFSAPHMAQILCRAQHVWFWAGGPGWWRTHGSACSPDSSQLKKKNKQVLTHRCIQEKTSCKRKRAQLTTIEISGFGVS